MDTVLCIHYHNWVGAMLPKLMPFEYNYSTHQRIAKSYHKTSTWHYTNIKHLFKVLVAHTPNNLTSKFKGIQACSESPLSYRQWRKSLADTDWIAHQYSQPSRPVQVHQVEYMASRTSPTWVYVPRIVGWLRRRTFQSSPVLLEASPPRWAVNPHSPLESP
jgi:hypothetical protein